LNLIDAGKSAFHGHHRTEGKLGDFLSAVESGKVSRGSILLVENIDRLSREGALSTLKDIIFKLWDQGITLQTLSPEETYEPNCNDSGKWMGLLFCMQRAQEESQRKSDLIRASRDRGRVLAREQKKILTSRAPAWMYVDDQKTFQAIPEAADVVRLIFDLRLKGVSVRAIEKRLNGTSAWTPPPRKNQKTRGWRASYIKKILSNPAVIGIYQPHRKIEGKREPIGDPISDYYPVVIASEVFNAVQQQLAANKFGNGKAGRTGKAGNIFRGIVKCAYCSGPMRLDDKGKPPKGRKYLVCYNGERNERCKPVRIRYDECVDVVLNQCYKLAPDRVLPNPDEQAQKCDSLRTRLAGGATELSNIDRRLNNLGDQIAEEDDKAIRRRLRNKMLELQSHKQETEETCRRNERELKKAMHIQQSFERWKRDIATLRHGIDDDEAIELRMRLQSHLKEFIETIEVFSVGFKRQSDRSSMAAMGHGQAAPEKNDTQTKRNRRSTKWKQRGQDKSDDFEEYIDAVAAEHSAELLRDSGFRKFVKHVMDLRMSRQGRFLRVKFKTGRCLDLVPPGSVATGQYATKRRGRSIEWRFTSPDLDKLWKAYLA